MRLKRTWVLAIAIASAPAIVALTLYFTAGRFMFRREALTTPKPEAPPDLAKLRPSFAAGLGALQRGDGPAAIHHFSAFNCGGRDVEEYRLFFLANGYQLTGNAYAARKALGELWSRLPRLIYWSDAGMTLGALYSAAADWEHAGAVYRMIA